MSLTRVEWVEMWESVKSIEIHSIHLMSKARHKGTRAHAGIILREVDKIKEQIQSVIGQME